MSVFVHAQGIKTVHAGEGVQKLQNSVHVVVEWPQRRKRPSAFLGTFFIVHSALRHYEPKWKIGDQNFLALK